MTGNPKRLMTRNDVIAYIADLQDTVGSLSYNPLSQPRAHVATDALRAQYTSGVIHQIVDLLVCRPELLFDNDRDVIVSAINELTGSAYTQAYDHESYADTAVNPWWVDWLACTMGRTGADDVLGHDPELTCILSWMTYNRRNTATIADTGRTTVWLYTTELALWLTGLLYIYNFDFDAVRRDVMLTTQTIEEILLGGRVNMMPDDCAQWLSKHLPEWQPEYLGNIWGGSPYVTP